MQNLKEFDLKYSAEKNSSVLIQTCTLNVVTIHDVEKAIDAISFIEVGNLNLSSLDTSLHHLEVTPPKNLAKTPGKGAQ
jgi:hypothetical protein